MVTSCQSMSYDGFREKGRAKMRSLTAELKMIRTKDQLIERQGILKHEFTDLRNLADTALYYRSQHMQNEIPPLELVDHELSDQLKSEILRVYRIEGGSEVMDGCLLKKL